MFVPNATPEFNNNNNNSTTEKEGSKEGNLFWKKKAIKSSGVQSYARNQIIVIRVEM